MERTSLTSRNGLVIARSRSKLQEALQQYLRYTRDDIADLEERMKGPSYTLEEGKGHLAESARHFPGEAAAERGLRSSVRHGRTLPESSSSNLQRSPVGTARRRPAAGSMRS